MYELGESDIYDPGVVKQSSNTFHGVVAFFNEKNAGLTRRKEYSRCLAEFMYYML